MATDYSAFDAPTLPPPATGGAPLPPPAPAAELPTLPGLPDLPPPATAPTASAPSLDEFPVDPGEPTGSRPAREPGRRLPIGWLVVVFALAVVGIAGYLVLTGDSGDDETPSDNPADVPDAAPAAPADEPVAEEPSSPIAQTLDEANQVVDDINDNGQEAELLEELGLDATGNPLPDDPPLTPGPEISIESLAGYRFTWADPSGQDLDVTVDSTTGDFAVVASDGISFRRIDDVFFGQDGAEGEWYQLASDPFGDVPVVGLDGVPTGVDVVPAAAREFVTSNETLADGSGVIVIDDAAFAAAALEARNDWLRPWGLLDETAASASTVTVTMTLDPSGEFATSARLDAPALGGAASITLAETFETAPTIEHPLSGG